MYSIKGYGIDMNGSDIAYDEKEGVVIYSDVYPTESAKAVNPKLTLKVNTAGTLELTLPPGNAGYKRLRKMVSEIVVYRDNVERWSGRIIGQKFDFNNNEILTCEGELAYLNDTTQPPDSYNCTVANFLKTVIDEHNRQIDQSIGILEDELAKVESEDEKNEIKAVIAFEEKKKFKLGAVEIGDMDEHEFVTDYKDTLTTITENLIDKFGGYLIIRKIQNERYLDYKKGEYAEAASVQQIRFGLNLLDYTKNWDLSDLVTVIIPRGASLDDFTTSELVDYYNKPYTSEAKKAYEAKHGAGSYICKTVGSSMYNKPIPEDRTGVKKRNDAGIESYFANSWGGFWRDYWNERKSGEDGKSYGAYLDLCFDQSSWSLENCDTKPEINPGDRYFTSAEAIKKFGWICAVVDFEDVKDVDTLRQKAKEYMEDKQFGEMIIEVTSIDLRYLGVVDEANAIRLLDKVRCVSSPHGLDKEFVVTELTIDFANPDNSTYTMTTEATASESGGTVSTFTEATVVQNEETKKESGTMLQNAFSAATNIINSATRGHVTITRDVNGTEALYIIDNSTVNGDPLWNFNPETGYWGEPGDHIEMWKWNLGGLGWSTDGGRTFKGLAMTNDGAIVADRITTGVLSTVLIRSADHNSWWYLGGIDREINGKLYKAGEFHITRGEITLGGHFENNELVGYNFKVDDHGELYSISGEIGGFTISNYSLSNSTLELNTDGLFIKAPDQIKMAGNYSIKNWTPDSDEYGLTISIETETSFIAFGYLNSSQSEYYNFKLLYASPQSSLHSSTDERYTFEPDCWYFGSNVNYNGNLISNAYIDSDTCILWSKSKNKVCEGVVKVITDINFESKTYSYKNLVFKNGFLVWEGF